MFALGIYILANNIVNSPSQVESARCAIATRSRIVLHNVINRLDFHEEIYLMRKEINIFILIILYQLVYKIF